MRELSIKIKIANRVYPLTVNTDEEEGIRKAANNINKAVAEYEKMYNVKDKQDLLAMVALKMASNNFQLENGGASVNAQVGKDLLQLEQILNKYL